MSTQPQRYEHQQLYLYGKSVYKKTESNEDDKIQCGSSWTCACECWAHFIRTYTANDEPHTHCEWTSKTRKSCLLKPKWKIIMHNWIKSRLCGFPLARIFISTNEWARASVQTKIRRTALAFHTLIYVVHHQIGISKTANKLNFNAQNKNLKDKKTE